MFVVIAIDTDGAKKENAVVVVIVVVAISGTMS